MHVLLDFIAQLTAPLWRVAREKPWQTTFVLAVASVICFLLEIQFVRTFLALAACSVVIAKAERDMRLQREVTASQPE